MNEVAGEAVETVVLPRPRPRSRPPTQPQSTTRSRTEGIVEAIQVWLDAQL